MPNGRKSQQKKSANAFRNDGSFLEMFKRMQQAQNGTIATASAPELEKPSSSRKEEKPAVAAVEEEEKKTLPLIGRRKAAKFLPVGKVKKVKIGEEGEEKQPKDAWSKYLAEVKKYKETHCEDEKKNRSLVK